MSGRRDVERPCHQLSVPFRGHHLERVGHLRENQLIKLLVEPPPAPHQLVDGAAVEGVRRLRNPEPSWAKAAHALHRSTVDKLMWGRRLALKRARKSSTDR